MDDDAGERRATISEFIASVRRDIERAKRGYQGSSGALAILMTNRGVQAVLIYRISHWLWQRRVPLLPLLLTRISQVLFAIDISYQAAIGPGLVIVHGVGLVIGSAVVIEGDCYLFHGVTLGDRGSEWVGSTRTDGHPVLEKEVMVGAGAKILGPIRIGHHSVIGANAVVLADVPAWCVAAGVPARIVSTRNDCPDDMRPPGDESR